MAKQDVLIVYKDGLGKRVPAGDFPTQGRGGRGLKAVNPHSEGAEIACAKLVGEDDEFMVITSKGRTVRLAASSVACTSRTARGVRVMELEDREWIASMAVLP